MKELRPHEINCVFGVSRPTMISQPTVSFFFFFAALHVQALRPKCMFFALGICMWALECYEIAIDRECMCDVRAARNSLALDR